MKYHYVYRITNIQEGMHYYGSRTSLCPPIEDIGIKYFSSSKDEDFIKSQKMNPERYRYKIVRVLDSREEALKLEIKLHEKFNVGINESFYNRAKQSSVGFDRSGVRLTNEHKTLISKSLKGRIFSQETLNKISNKLQNRIFSDEHRAKLSERKSGENNPMFGHKLSDERKYQISLIHKNKVVSDETRKRLSKKLKGRIISDETKLKMSENSKGERNGMFGKVHPSRGKQRPKIKCPHCGKLGAKAPMTRWHFDNCKYRG